MEKTTRLQPILDALVSLAVLVAAGVIVYTSAVKSPQPTKERPPELPTDAVSIAGATAKGLGTAPVVIIEYTDFQCSFCATFARNTLPGLMREYVDRGIAQLVIRHVPIEPRHPFAAAAAVAAECAGRQGAFWQMHDLLFSEQANLGNERVDVYADRLGLKGQDFSNCVTSNIGQHLAKEAAQAKAIGVTGTPTFLIGTRESDDRVRVKAKLRGAKSLRDFGAVIEELKPNGSQRLP